MVRVAGKLAVLPLRGEVDTNETCRIEDTRPRIDSISVRWVEDYDAEEQHEPGDCDACDAGETPEGCYAVASVSYAVGDEARRMETFRSGGLWGICTDNDDGEYRREVEGGELLDLRDHLAHFGVDVSDFDAKVKR